MTDILTAQNKIPIFDRIIDNIYLGDLEAILYLEKNKIDIVVNISNIKYNEISEIQYHYYNIDDNKEATISIYFNEFINLINTNLNKNIFVHCVNSVSRSVTLILAYLMTKNMNLITAYNYLKNKRTQYVSPNRGFVNQLIDHEFKLYNKNSMNAVAFYKKIKQDQCFYNT